MIFRAANRINTAILALVAAILLASASRASVSYLPMIEPAPAFALLDTEGHTVSSSQLKGGVVLMDFMYTHCTTVCSMVTERMASLAKSLTGAGELGKDVRLVSISFDPARDTPRWLATYSRSIGADAHSWLFLTGSRLQLADVMRRYDFHVTRLPNGDYDHVSRVYLIDPRGEVRQIYSASFLDPVRVERDIASLLAERRQADRIGSR